MNIFIRNMWLCCLFGAVVACGSDGGGSNSSVAGDNGTDAIEVARISAENAEDLGVGAASGARQAVDYQDVSALGFRPEARPGIETFSEELSAGYAARTARAPDPVTCITGSITETSNADGSTTFDFDMCGVDLDGLLVVTVDGLVTSNSSVSGDITTVELLYDGFSIDLGAGFGVYTIDLEAVCSTDNTTMETSCDFPGVDGFDGRIYDLSEATVTGDAFSGYFVTATIDDPDHGTFSITTNAAIVFACANDRPLAGELQFTDGAGVLVTVTFNDCDSFTVAYDGTAELYFW